MPTAVATLRILQPGDRANAILIAIESVVVPCHMDDGSYRLTFEYASPMNAQGVLSAVLRVAGFKDWRNYVALEVEGLPLWLYTNDPRRRRRSSRSVTTASRRMG